VITAPEISEEAEIDESIVEKILLELGEFAGLFYDSGTIGKGLE